MMPEKRKLGNNQVKTNTKVILLDIEGTTTSISFVKVNSRWDTVHFIMR